MNKNKIKKIILAFLLASVSVACFGCHKDNSENESGDAPTEAEETASMTQPSGNSVANDANESKEEDATESDKTSDFSPDSAQDTSGASLETAPDKPVNVTEQVEVTDTSGQPVTDATGKKQTEVVNVTEQVKVTDTSGQPVTNATGKAQTEAVNITEKPATTTQAEKATEKPAETVSSYTPSMSICDAYWIDEKDFFFNGEFLAIEFQVNEGIPDGSYPITFKKTDISNWDVIKLNPVCINGEVAVNCNITAQEDLPAEEFGLRINSVAAKQGDTVKVTVDLNNNPGFCGFVIELEYDKSALTIVSTESGADFENAVNYVTN